MPVELFTDVTATVTTLVVPEGGELPPPEAVSDIPPEASEQAAQVSDTPEEAPAGAPAEEIEPTQ